MDGLHGSALADAKLVNRFAPKILQDQHIEVVVDQVGFGHSGFVLSNVDGKKFA